MNCTDRALGELLRGTVTCACGQEHPYPQDWDGGKWVCAGCKLLASMLAEEKKPTPAIASRELYPGDIVRRVTAGGTVTRHEVRGVYADHFVTVDNYAPQGWQCAPDHVPNAYNSKWEHVDGAQIIFTEEDDSHTIPF